MVSSLFIVCNVRSEPVLRGIWPHSSYAATAWCKLPISRLKGAVIWSWLAHTSAGSTQQPHMFCSALGLCANAFFSSRESHHVFKIIWAACYDTQRKSLQLKCSVWGMHLWQKGDNTFQYMLSRSYAHVSWRLPAAAGKKDHSFGYRCHSYASV